MKEHSYISVEQGTIKLLNFFGNTNSKNFEFMLDIRTTNNFPSLVNAQKDKMKILKAE